MSSVKKSAFPAFKFDSDSYRGKDVQPSAELAERVRAAARAALKSKPIGVSTVFIDTSPHKPASGASASNFGFRHPGDRSSTSTSHDDEKDGNPLAALLTYTDDSSDSEDSPRAAGGADGCSEQTSSKDLDIELASFMMELETSGLLKEKDSAGGPPPSPHPDATAHSATQPRSNAPQQDASYASAAHPGAGAYAAAASTSAATHGVPDQKVLGYLVGAPAWCKVEDSGSGKIYYWNMATNGVAWHPPNNADGDDLRDTSQLASDAADDAAAAMGAGGGGAAGTEPGAPLADAGDAAGSKALAVAREGGGAEGGSGASSDADMEDGELEAPEPTGVVGAPGREAAKQLAAVAADVEAAAAVALAAAPAAVRQLLPLLHLLVEVRLRQADWQALGAQRGAAGEGPTLTWGAYERRVVDAVGRVRGELPEAVALAGRCCRRDEEEEEEEDGEVVAAGPASSRHPPLPEDPCLPPPLPESTDAPLPPYDDAPTPPPPGLEGPTPTPPSSPPPPLPSDPTTSHYPHDPSSAAYPYPSPAPPSIPLGTEALEFLSAGVAGVSAAAAAVAAANPISAASRATEYSGEAILTPPDAAAPAASAPSEPPAALPAPHAQPEPGAAAAAPVGVKKAKSKKVSQMIDKWTAVSRSLEEEERQRAKREAEDADPEAAQKKRKVEIEHWKEQQLLTGQADVNANFQPVHGDWRQRVKAKGSSTSGSKQQHASNGSRAAGSSKPPSADLDALSAGLPKGWRAMREKATGDIYYGNLQTKEVTWDRPS